MIVARECKASMKASPPAPVRPTPLLGEHSADVLAEAGLDAQEVEALLASGAALAESG